jgi:hypothetical protein
VVPCIHLSAATDLQQLCKNLQRLGCHDAFQKCRNACVGNASTTVQWYARHVPGEDIQVIGVTVSMLHCPDT